MGAAAWALAFVILIGITLFRFPDEWRAILRAIATLLQKTKKVGLSGIEAQDNPPPPSPDERRAIETFLRSFDNPLVREQEETIARDLNHRGIQSPHDREQALIATLARTQIVLNFERIHSTIWGSQQKVLSYLNERPAGAADAEVRSFYDAAKGEFGVIYDTYSYESWLSYLQTNLLIATKDRAITESCVQS